jgi:membrane associated rhomboid family serine protease
MVNLLVTVYTDYVPFITIGIVVFTCVFSFWAFNREDRLNKYSFMPYQIKYYKEHYRFLSHAFIHADELHLILNMFGLYIFGRNLEFHFNVSETFGRVGGEALFLLLYSTAIYAAIIPQQLKLKEDRYYSSLGASGAVNAIIFAGILVSPMDKMGLIFIPGIHIPAWIFGLIYLVVSYFLAKRKSNNPMSGRINHEAHFWGAFYGIIFMAIVEPKLLVQFYQQITGNY